MLHLKPKSSKEGFPSWRLQRWHENSVLHTGPLWDCTTTALWSWRSWHQTFASGQTCVTDTPQNCDTVTGHGCCCAFHYSFFRSTVPRVMVSNWSKRLTEVHPYPPVTLFPWSAPLQSPSYIPCSNWLWFDQYFARNWKDDCLEDSAER